MYLLGLTLLALTALAHSAPMVNTDHHVDVPPFGHYKTMEPFPDFFERDIMEEKPTTMHNYPSLFNPLYYYLLDLPYDQVMPISVPHYPPPHIAPTRGIHPILKLKTYVINNKNYFIPETITFPLDIVNYTPIPTNVHETDDVHKPVVVTPTEVVVSDVNHVIPTHAEVHEGVEGHVSSIKDESHVIPVPDKSNEVVDIVPNVHPSHEGPVTNTVIGVIDNSATATHDNIPVIPVSYENIINPDTYAYKNRPGFVGRDYVYENYGPRGHHGYQGHHGYHGYQDNGLHISSRFEDDNRDEGPKKTIDTSKKNDIPGVYNQGSHGTGDKQKNNEDKQENSVPSLMENVSVGGGSSASRLNEIGKLGGENIK